MLEQGSGSIICKNGENQDILYNFTVVGLVIIMLLCLLG